MAAVAVVTLLTLPGGASGPDPLPSLALRARPPVGRIPAAARVSRSQCADLAVKLAVAKARAEMSALLPASSADPDAVAQAMASDRRFARRVEQVFGASDLIKSEYSAGRGCVVTVQLPLDRLQLLAGAR